MKGTLSARARPLSPRACVERVARLANHVIRTSPANQAPAVEGACVTPLRHREAYVSRLLVRTGSGAPMTVANLSRCSGSDAPPHLGAHKASATIASVLLPRPALHASWCPTRHSDIANMEDVPKAEVAALGVSRWASGATTMTSCAKRVVSVHFHLGRASYGAFSDSCGEPPVVHESPPPPQWSSRSC